MDRVAFMRKAYKAMVKDPAFLADAKRQRLSIKPADGETIQALVNATYALDRKLVNRMRSNIYRKRAKRKSRKK